MSYVMVMIPNIPDYSLPVVIVVRVVVIVVSVIIPFDFDPTILTVLIHTAMMNLGPKAIIATQIFDEEARVIKKKIHCKIQ